MKSTITITIVCALLLSSGCSCIKTPVGYTVVSGGFIYTRVIYPSSMETSTLPSGEYKLIRRVHGTSETRSILGLVATGDGGLNAAKKDALSDLKRADDIINPQVDTEVMSIFNLFTISTTHLRGMAVEYNQKVEE